MIDFSSIWLFLLVMRECVNIFTSTTALTILITLLQFLHLVFLMEREKWHFTWIHIAFCVLFLLCIFNSNSLPTANIVLSIILLKKSDIKSVSMVITLSFLVGIFIYLGAFNLGILQDGTKIYAKGMTHDLGFKNSNTPGLQFMMFTICASTFLRLSFRIKFPLLLFLIPNYFIYLLTIGRTAFYSVCLYFLLMYYFSFRRKYSIEEKGMTILPALLFFITFLLLNFYSQIPIVNLIFTGRFRINANTFKNFSIANYFFGYKVEEGPMDSAYLGVLFNGGILSVLTFLFFSCKGIANMPTKKAKVFFPFIIVILLSGFTEGTFSLFRPATVLFYKILADQFAIRFISAKYLKPFGGKNE